MRVLLLLLTGLGAAVTIISLTGPDVDLAVAHLFADPATGRFPAASQTPLAMLRDHGYVSIVSCLGVVAAAVAGRWVPRLTVSARVATYLALSLALGSGLLVNAVFKDQWHRPRPIMVHEFGGTQQYVDWWNPGGTCGRNCSFPSGEVASAAWMFGPAMLAPPPWRVVAVAGAAAFTIAVALARMAVGGHFLSDVIFGALMSVLTLWIVGGLVFRWRRPALKESQTAERNSHVRTA